MKIVWTKKTNYFSSVVAFYLNFAENNLRKLFGRYIVFLRNKLACLNLPNFSSLI
jgi:hypothetical protein